MDNTTPDTQHNPLDSKEYPTMHRVDVREYVALEPKMCENCDNNFLRAVGSPVKYCRDCRKPASMVGREHENCRASVGFISSRERAAALLP